MYYLITCEHGGNQVPRPYHDLFARANSVLTSHRGYDPGALEVARRLARRLRVPLVFATVTRLLVDLNRSLGNPEVFSRYTESLGDAGRALLVERYYRPYRDKVEDLVRTALESGAKVAHISIHSFTPVRKGERRHCDIGLLFDPDRPLETRLMEAWQAALQRRRPTLVVRLNYPYHGLADGLTTYLRGPGGKRYAGVELEINQKWVRRPTWPGLQRDIVEALAEVKQALG